MSFSLPKLMTAGCALGWIVALGPAVPVRFLLAHGVGDTLGTEDRVKFARISAATAGDVLPVAGPRPPVVVRPAAAPVALELGFGDELSVTVGDGEAPPFGELLGDELGLVWLDPVDPEGAGAAPEVLVCLHAGDVVGLECAP